MQIFTSCLIFHHKVSYSPVCVQLPVIRNNPHSFMNDIYTFFNLALCLFFSFFFCFLNRFEETLLVLDWNPDIFLHLRDLILAHTYCGFTILQWGCQMGSVILWYILWHWMIIIFIYLDIYVMLRTPLSKCSIGKGASNIKRTRETKKQFCRSINKQFFNKQLLKVLQIICTMYHGTCAKTTTKTTL